MFPISRDLFYYSHWEPPAHKYEYIMQQPDIIQWDADLQSSYLPHCINRTRFQMQMCDTDV